MSVDYSVGNVDECIGMKTESQTFIVQLAEQLNGQSEVHLFYKGFSIGECMKVLIMVFSFHNDFNVGNDLKLYTF